MICVSCIILVKSISFILSIFTFKYYSTALINKNTMGPSPDSSSPANKAVSIEPATEDDDHSQVSYDPSLNSVDISIDNQSSMKEPKGFPASIQDKVSEGLRRFLAHWRILLLGQFLSVLLACSSALSASMHFECNISSPTFQTALVFSLMSFHAFALVKKNKFTAEEKTGLDSREDGQRRPQDGGATNAALGSSFSLDSTDGQEDRRQSNLSGIDEKDNGTESVIVLPPGSHSMCCGVLPLNVPWWSYAIFAFILVEASYFTFLAYRYTTLPSCALLDNTNILAAMIGSRLILKRRYSWTHVLGAMICCIGVVLNLASDFRKAKEDPAMIDDDAALTEAEEYPRRMLGDFLSILGGLLVGLSDVLIELLLKDFVSIHEYLGSVGIWGTFIAAVQAIIMERTQIAKIFAGGEENTMTTKEIYESYPDDPFDAPRTCSRNMAMSLVFGYAISTYLFNYSMTRFLSVSESALLTLSLLTADLYSVIFTVVAEHIPPTGLFYVAFVTVIVGVVVYEMAPSPLGNAEDLEMESGIELEREKSYFGINDVQLSWGSSRDKGGENGSSGGSSRHELL